MIEIVFYLLKAAALAAAVYSFRKKMVVLGCMLVVAACGVQVYNYLNPAPREIKKIIISLPAVKAGEQPDSLYQAAYLAEQLLSLQKDYSVLSLKHYLLSAGRNHQNVDTISAVLNADDRISLSLKDNLFEIDINGKKSTASSLKGVTELLSANYSLPVTNLLPASSQLILYLRNLQNGQDTLNSRLPVNTLSLADRYVQLSRQDSSKIRDTELNSLLLDLNKTADYWWKKSGLKIRILLSLSNYYEAFRILKAQKAFLANQPEYYYLLSKFSYNRFRELGYTSKYEIRELAKNHIGADLDMLSELAETFYLDGFNNDAEFLYRKLVRIYPFDVHYKSQLGVVISRLNRVEEAAAILEECVERDSTDWLLQYNLGVQYFWFDKKKARQTFLKAAALGDTVNSLLFLGRLAYDDKDYKTALNYFRERVRHETGRDDPNWLEALKGIRRCREQLKMNDSLQTAGAAKQ